MAYASTNGNFITENEVMNTNSINNMNLSNNYMGD